MSKKYTEYPIGDLKHIRLLIENRAEVVDVLKELAQAGLKMSIVNKKLGTEFELKPPTP